jgi:sirohydrochlorin ferrochelatase
MSTGYIVFAHGSSVESANEAVRAVAREMANRGKFEVVEAAFLEQGQPDLMSAVDQLADRVAHIVVVPYFLTLGLHLRRDLPELVRQAQHAHPGLSIEVTPPLDGHPSMADVLVARAREASGV